MVSTVKKTSYYGKSFCKQKIRAGSGHSENSYPDPQPNKKLLNFYAKKLKLSTINVKLF